MNIINDLHLALIRQRKLGCLVTSNGVPVDKGDYRYIQTQLIRYNILVLCATQPIVYLGLFFNRL